MMSLLERLLKEKGFLWYGFGHFLCLIFFTLFYRFRSFGHFHVPGTGGVLLASTHQSFFDPILVGLPLNRQVNQMARASLFRNRLFARFIRSLGAFPIEQGRGDREALQQGIKLLREGACLLVFPEGTRTRDGSIGELQAGIFLMARRAGVPIVPVTIEGAFDSWPRQRGLFRLFGSIRVAYGPRMAAEKGSVMQVKVREEMIRLQAELKHSDP